MSKDKLYYATPVLLGVLIFSSNFLSPKLFTGEILNFAVWFILSIFAFSCGWIISKTLGWRHGGRLIFAVIVATAFMSVFLVSFFSAYFGINDLVTENLILYSLRNIILGSMGIFGLAVAELLHLEREIQTLRIKNDESERITQDAKREADIIIREAKSKANEVLSSAEKKAGELVQRKNWVEQQLREFIRTEKELINKYETEEDK